MKHLRAAALLCFIIYLFHILRNLTPAYLALLGLSLAVFFVLLIRNLDRGIQKFDIAFFYFIFAWIFSSLTTLLVGSEYGNPAIGLFRLWAAFPLALICLVLSTDSARRPARALAIFFLLAAASFPIQYFFGPIAWFAEASERAGGTRFASLAGSLTAYGVAVGVPALAGLFYFRRLQGLAIFIVLSLGALLSLQKAALANIMLALAFAWWLKRIPTKTILLSTPPAALIIAIFAFMQGFENDKLETAFRYAQGILTSQSELSYDVSFLESIVDRITALPYEAISHYGADSLLLGVGAFGGAGALGYEDLPMAHNGLVELILVFGYFAGGSIIAFMLFLFLNSFFLLLNRKIAANTEDGFLSASYIIWFANYVFSGGGIFHPIGAAVFWLLVFRIRHIGREERRLKRMQGSLNAGVSIEPVPQVRRHDTHVSPEGS